MPGGMDFSSMMS